MRRCLKYFMYKDFGIGFYTKPELSWDQPYYGKIYRLSLGFITLTYWR